MNDPTAKYWDGISASIGVPLEGLSFTYAAFDFNRERVTRESGGVEYPQRHCTAAEFCCAFVQLAKNTFGDDYIAALTSWQLNSSEKLGQIVFALADHNLIGKQDSDLQSDFNGQFDFSDLGLELPPARAYDYPTTNLPPVILPQPRRRASIISFFIGVAVWSGIMLAAAEIANYFAPDSVMPVLLVTAIAIGILGSSIRYPYRFNLRVLLIVITLVAVALGLFSYLSR